MLIVHTLGGPSGVQEVFNKCDSRTEKLGSGEAATGGAAQSGESTSASGTGGMHSHGASSSSSSRTAKRAGAAVRVGKSPAVQRDEFAAAAAAEHKRVQRRMSRAAKQSAGPRPRP